MTEDGLKALVKSVNESIGGLTADLEDVQIALVDTNAKLAELPKTYIPRTEADKKAEVIKKVLAGLMITSAFVIMLVTYSLLDNYHDEARFTSRCEDTRSTLESVIKTAVADREPLPTSNAETRAAIEEQNIRIRELREKLLSFDGTHPEKC